MKIIISLLFLYGSVSMSAQSIQYVYDNTGNRIQRKVLTMLMEEGGEQVASREDTTQAEAGAVLQQRTQVFPNPTQDRLQVQLQEPLPEATIELFDMAGKRILRQPMPDASTSIDIRDQQAGTYILVIRGKDFSARWKVVKQ